MTSSCWRHPVLGTPKVLYCVVLEGTGGREADLVAQTETALFDPFGVLLYPPELFRVPDFTEDTSSRRQTRGLVTRLSLLPLTPLVLWFPLLPLPVLPSHFTKTTGRNTAGLYANDVRLFRVAIES